MYIVEQLSQTNSCSMIEAKPISVYSKQLRNTGSVVHLLKSFQVLSFIYRSHFNLAASSFTVYYNETMHLHTSDATHRNQHDEPNLEFRFVLKLAPNRRGMSLMNLCINTMRFFRLPPDTASLRGVNIEVNIFYFTVTYPRSEERRVRYCVLSQ